LVRGLPVVRGCSQALSEEESLAKIVPDTVGMKNTPICVCAKMPLLGDLQQKGGELVLSTTSCPSVILENTFKLVYEKMWLW
jgi:hypothetical protein